MASPPVTPEEACSLLTHTALTLPIDTTPTTPPLPPPSTSSGSSLTSLHSYLLSADDSSVSSLFPLSLPPLASILAHTVGLDLLSSPSEWLRLVLDVLRALLRFPSASAAILAPPAPLLTPLIRALMLCHVSLVTLRTRASLGRQAAGERKAPAKAARAILAAMTATRNALLFAATRKSEDNNDDDGDGRDQGEEDRLEAIGALLSDVLKVLTKLVRNGGADILLIVIRDLDMEGKERSSGTGGPVEVHTPWHVLAAAIGSQKSKSVYTLVRSSRDASLLRDLLLEKVTDQTARQYLLVSLASVGLEPEGYALSPPSATTKEKLASPMGAAAASSSSSSASSPSSGGTFSSRANLALDTSRHDLRATTPIQAHSSSDHGDWGVDLDWEAVVRGMRHRVSGIAVRDRTYRLKSYSSVFVGSECVDWILAQEYSGVDTRDTAVELGRVLCEAGLFSHCKDEHGFRDAYLFYAFAEWDRVDPAGVVRGQCETCGEAGCPGYVPPPDGSGYACSYCGCPPGHHSNAEVSSVSSFLDRMMALSHSGMDAEEARSVVRAVGENSWPQLAKVVVVGNSGVGKTSVCRRANCGPFDAVQPVTLGVDFIFFKASAGSGEPVQLQVWDTAGRDGYGISPGVVYESAHAVLIVYDVTDGDSFASVQARWLPELARHSVLHPSRVVLVANKNDATSARVVDYEQGSSLAASHGIHYVETSAKTTINVTYPFQLLASTFSSDPKLAKSCVSLPIDDIGSRSGSESSSVSTPTSTGGGAGGGSGGGGSAGRRSGKRNTFLRDPSNRDKSCVVS